MAVIVSNIKQRLSDTGFDCLEAARRKAGISSENILERHIYRRSVDARRKNEIVFVYSVLFRLRDEGAVSPAQDLRFLREEPEQLVFGAEPLAQRPVVIGFGPAGIFCALTLARNGYRPLVLERGPAMPQRAEAVARFFTGGAFSPVGNVQFGEGGAGTFSDGKLTTRIGDAACADVLRDFVAHGAPEEILYEAKPHIGTDVLRNVVVSLRGEIEARGGEVRFLTAVEDFDVKDGVLRGITAAGTAIPVAAAVLAVGHSARDTFETLLRREVPIEAKPFSVGARIEHLQSEIDRCLYGASAGHPLLPPGEYQLSHRESSGRAVYTFCMCPGGLVVPAASEEGGIVTNGMSYHSRDGKNANSALVVSVGPEDFGADPLSGIAFQRRIERAAYAASGSFSAPVQTVGRLLAGKAGAELGAVIPTYGAGRTPGDFAGIFPEFVLREMCKGISLFSRNIGCFSDSDAVLTAPETRTSSPVRVVRTAAGESLAVRGLYPCGEGCGYAGGIMSAATDGIRAAKQIMSKYKPFD